MQTPDPDAQPEFYAGLLSKRLVAWLIDALFTLLLCLLVLPFTAFTALFYWPLLWLVVGFFYRVATLANGSATWGMRLVAMELRDAEDRRLSGGLALMHTLGYSISVAMAPLQLISVLMMMLSPRRQGLADLLLGTVPLNRRRQGEF